MTRPHVRYSLPTLFLIMSLTIPAHSTRASTPRAPMGKSSTRSVSVRHVQMCSRSSGKVVVLEMRTRAWTGCGGGCARTGAGGMEGNGGRCLR
ncbi:hypothetical protein JB92DRAFT_468117 [Gautieria morchelliformis]|nr:hypothetical protein JB92DRAFT_468117 [Gautieria morchelliformis]